MYCASIIAKKISLLEIRSKSKLTAMTTIDQESLLFDDASVIKQLFGQQELIIPSANANCDCIGYSTSDDEDIRTNQIATTAGQAH